MDLGLLDPNLQQYQEWLHHPVTQGLRKALQELVVEAMENWSNGAYVRDHLSEAGALGYIKGLRALIELDASQLQGIIEK